MERRVPPDGSPLTGQSTTSATVPCGGTVRAALRLCLGVVGAALLVTGSMFLWSGLRLRAACREAEAAEVLNIRVDVGAPSRHRATLKQIAAFPCRQYIRMAAELREGEDAEDLFRGLELTITVKDNSGVEWMTGGYPSPFTEPHDPGSVTVVDGTPMPVGEYSVVVDVVNPAPALAGRPVQLVSGYVLCGIEWIGPTVGIGGGAAALVIGAIVAATLWATRGRWGRPRDYENLPAPR